MRNESTPDHADEKNGSPQRQTMHPALWVILAGILAFFVYVILFL